MRFSGSGGSATPTTASGRSVALHDFLLIYAGEIDLTEAGYGRHTLDLGDDFGFSGELNYRYRQARHSSLQLGLQVKTWDFGRSNSKTITNGSNISSITEPDSTAVQTTFSASYIHHF